MKFRYIPLIVSALITFAVLMGGWFAYKSFAMENPLLTSVNRIAGVEHAAVDVATDRVTVAVTPKQNASLRGIYENVQKQGASLAGGRELVILVHDQTNDRLEKLWSAILFDVAQAMETKQYSAIPASLRQLERLNPGIVAVAEMDNANVYIRLIDGAYSKFVVLPRTSDKIGVWPNE